MNLLDFLLEPLSFDFMVRALVTTVMLVETAWTGLTNR